MAFPYPDDPPTASEANAWAAEDEWDAARRARAAGDHDTATYAESMAREFERKAGRG